MKHVLLLPLTVFLTICSYADPYARQDGIDVQHYRFQVELTDSGNRVRGEAMIHILFKKPTNRVSLDLTSANANGNGMKVSKVAVNSVAVSYHHTDSKLVVTLPAVVGAGETRIIEVTYSGIPEEGLVISKTKFGDRTFFADHWPDRGHQWLPCIDHPADKATVEFVIIAPEHYQVIASGLLFEESSLPGGRKLTRYSEKVPIPTKVMAVGVARFAMKVSGIIDHIPQSIWVYPQNRDKGFRDLEVSVRIFEYFHQAIGPYSYEKLAHVQSRTRWGGLENAGNIFYTESVVGGKNPEKLIAHETAHQWFGNSVAERDWYHVWLSEGFATYFALLYLEHTYGTERMTVDLKTDRANIITYYRKNPKPIVDTTITEIEKVLSTNTYQKASWVLHMLRNKIGDEAFWKGIRTYYATYQNGNVLTGDFQKVMEGAAGQDLGPFFRQWFFRAGHPNFVVSWSYNATRKSVAGKLVQQKEPFAFPLDIRLRLTDGSILEKTLEVNSSTVDFVLPANTKPDGLDLDPHCRLLFEGSVKQR